MSSGGHKTSAIPRPKTATRTRTHGASKAKARPKSKKKSPAARKPQRKPTTKQRTDRARDDSRFADFTRPVSVEKQLVRGRKRRIIGIGAAVITAAFIAALFVLPVQAWLRQQDDLERKNQQLAALQEANAELANEVAQLQTPEGIEQAAREEIGYVQRGEIRYTVLPPPDAPLQLPSGWPYDTIAQIVAVRAQASARP